MRANLAIEVVLPDPFTPTTMITVGPLAANAIGCSSWAQQAREFGPDGLENLVHLDQAAAGIRAHLLADRVRRPSAHVRADQDREQVAQEVVVDQPSFLLEQVANVRCSAAALIVSAAFETGLSNPLFGRGRLHGTDSAAPAPQHSFPSPGVSAFCS